MKILWLNGHNNPNFGGTEIHTIQMVKELKSKGIDVIMVVAKGSYVDKHTDGVKKYYISFPNSLALLSTYKLIRVLKKEKPDFIIANNGKEYPNALISAKLSGVKTIFFRHMERMKSYGVRKFVFPYVDLFLAVGEHVKNNLIKEGVKQSKVEVLYNVIDEEKFLWKEKPKDGVNFLFVGKLDEGKGIFDLLSAFIKLLEVKKDIKCFYVGDGKDREKLRKAIQEKGLENKVFLLGYVKDVEKYYQMAHVCVVPSRETEAFARVALEAIACGCALVISQVGGTKEAVVEDYNGYVFKAKDVNDLFDKMLKASKEWERLSVGSLKLYKEKFSKEKTMEKFLSLLHMLKS